MTTLAPKTPSHYLLAGVLAAVTVGCSTLRTTDPSRTATEQFLLNEATRRSIELLSTAPLRDRLVFVDSTYLVGERFPTQAQFQVGDRATRDEQLFAVGELRAKLLEAGVRLTDDRAAAEAVVEVRAVGIGIDRLESLFGIPALALPQATQADVPILTPELAVFKRLRQSGYASIAFVAYWRDTGEVLSSSGPSLGRSEREDFWIFGFGPRTLGDIPPAKQ